MSLSDWWQHSKIDWRTMVKSLPRVLYHGVKILVNTVKKSIQEEIEMSRQLARIRYQGKETQEKEGKGTGMSLEEAQQILNISNNLDPQMVDKRYKHLLSANKNFKYLKSKVVRAKEVIDKELQKVKENSIKYMERSTQVMKDRSFSPHVQMTI